MGWDGYGLDRFAHAVTVGVLHGQWGPGSSCSNRSLHCVLRVFALHLSCTHAIIAPSVSCDYVYCVDKGTPAGFYPATRSVNVWCVMNANMRRGWPRGLPAPADGAR
mgnify:CR=1 FL=1